MDSANILEAKSTKCGISRIWGRLLKKGWSASKISRNSKCGPQQSVFLKKNMGRGLSERGPEDYELGWSCED